MTSSWNKWIARGTLKTRDTKQSKTLVFGLFQGLQYILWSILKFRSGNIYHHSMIRFAFYTIFVKWAETFKIPVDLLFKWQFWATQSLSNFYIVFRKPGYQYQIKAISNYFLGAKYLFWYQFLCIMGLTVKMPLAPWNKNMVVFCLFCFDCIDFYTLIQAMCLSIMMTSSNGNIFRVTGHLCGKFTGPRWISHTKASDAELWCLLWSASG